MKKQRHQLNLSLTVKENKTLRDRYKQYVNRAKSTEIVSYTAWAKTDLLTKGK